MKSFVEGSKYLVVSLKGLHCVNPFLVVSAPCRHSKTVPYWLVFKPRCVLYHSLILPGSLHLKNMPPIPVTFFFSCVSLFCVVSIVLNAKPEINDVAIKRMIKVVFFILQSYFIVSALLVF